ncbi:MAG: hypothetical protein WBU92_11650 [Candidatus Dormiibacterota bacterium]
MGEAYGSGRPWSKVLGEYAGMNAPEARLWSHPRPAGPILASIDGSLGLMETRGAEPLEPALEFADRDTLVPVVTIADDQRTVAALTGAIAEAVKSTGFGPARPRRPAASWQVRSTLAMSPRAAFFAAHERVPADLAIGRTAAELVAPYPPGIPVLSPGERITAPLLEAQRAAAASGVRIAYAADPSLGTLEVVRDQPTARSFLDLRRGERNNSSGDEFRG